MEHIVNWNVWIDIQGRMIEALAKKYEEISEREDCPDPATLIHMADTIRSTKDRMRHFQGD